MKIEIQTDSSHSTVLADDTPGQDYAPAGDVRGLAETTVQESKPIGADQRRLFDRKNVGGTLSFTVRPKYATLADAGEAVSTLLGRAGRLSGTLKVTNRGETSAPTWEKTGAVVQKVETRQIGVTVEAKYEIAF